MRLAVLPLLALLSYPALAASGGAIDVRLSTKGNNIAFDQDALQVTYGNDVTLRFVNEAAQNSEILHNIAVLKPGTLDEVIKELQKQEYNIDKMRENPSILAMTKALKPGESATVKFKPAAPGFYPYICLMAGHADMLGMKGTIAVVKKP